jgi:hypothetical protein
MRQVRVRDLPELEFRQGDNRFGPVASSFADRYGFPH